MFELLSTTSARSGNKITKTTKDYANVTEKAEITTERFDTPGKMTFSMLQKNIDDLSVGSAVRFRADGVNMFKGYIFKREDTFDGVSSFTAYDQLRYLKANASYAFKKKELRKIIQKIADDFQLKTGTLERTGYKFPTLIKENESCLDIIFDALERTIIETGKIYNFYDDFGELTLREVAYLYTDKLIGDASLLTDYTYTEDIDSETYNRVKLVKKNEKSGKTDAYVFQDSDTISKWGLLQYYDEITEDLNKAQIKNLCKQYLKYYNRILKTVKIDAIGIPELRAGMVVPIRIKNIGDLQKVALLIAEKVTHTFEGRNHTMSIEVKDFKNLKG